MNTVCTHCQAINRIPDDRIEDAAKCGRCGHDLFDGEVITATGETLDKLLKDDLPVVIDFWAPWCGPCQIMGPAFAQAAAAMPQLRFAKIDTQTETTLGQRFNIRSIPTLVLFVNGREVKRQAGAMDTASIQRWVMGALQQA